MSADLTNDEIGTVETAIAVLTKVMLHAQKPVVADEAQRVDVGTAPFEVDFVAVLNSDTYTTFSVGRWVIVTFEGERYLGTYLGELPVKKALKAEYHPSRKSLLVSVGVDTVVWVPALKRLVWGRESGAPWVFVTEAKQLTQVPLDNVWRTQALLDLEEERRARRAPK